MMELNNKYINIDNSKNNEEIIKEKIIEFHKLCTYLSEKYLKDG